MAEDVLNKLKADIAAKEEEFKEIVPKYESLTEDAAKLNTEYNKFWNLFFSFYLNFNLSIFRKILHIFSIFHFYFLLLSYFLHI